MDFTFSIIILIFSIVVHEVSHGFAAYYQGDNTAKFAGRLTLNPLKHLELFGSIVLPVLSYIAGGFIIGWAKPVPFNPYNLRNQRWGEAIVAIAGPASNIALATIFGLCIRFGQGSLSDPLLYIFTLITATNLILATFNLVPIPPLDGSKILFALFPNKLYQLRQTFEQYGIVLLIFFIFFLSRFLLPIVGSEFNLITGFPL